MSNGNSNGTRFKKSVKSKEPSALDIFKRIKELGSLANGNKCVVVFGPMPGIVEDVTVGIGGNLTLIYRELTAEEMGL